MNKHYIAVLADFERMKQDAEDGIRAMKRAISRSQSPLALMTEHGGNTSLPNRVVAFLQANPTKSYRAEDIAHGVGGEVNIKTLRASLGRMMKLKRLRRHGRGRYRAKPAR